MSKRKPCRFFCFMLLFVLFFSSTIHAQSGAFLSLRDSVAWQVVSGDTTVKLQPDNLLPFPAGEHLLDLRPLNDHLWQQRGFQMKALLQSGDTLQIIPPAVELPSFPPQSFKIIPQDRNGLLAQLGIRKTNLLSRPILLSATVITNWLAFYLKRQADESYRKYNRTSDLSAMNHYYAKTRQLDLYSNIALTVSAASLLTFFYLLIEE